MNLLLVSNSTQFGGGYLEHCRDRLVETIGSGRRRVVFVPFALADHDGYAHKARTAFEAMGYAFSSIHTAADAQALLADTDGVFVGGGNTFRLLRELYRQRLLEPLRARVAAGMPYIGSSAGSNVACLTIGTTNDMPIVEPPSHAALALVPFNINAHYLDPDPHSKHMGETREQRIRQFHEENPQPVVGLREGAMLRVDGERMTLLGVTGARLFRRGHEPQEHAPGADLSALLA